MRLNCSQWPLNIITLVVSELVFVYEVVLVFELESVLFMRVSACVVLVYVQSIYKNICLTISILHWKHNLFFCDMKILSPAFSCLFSLIVCNFMRFMSIQLWKFENLIKISHVFQNVERTISILGLLRIGSYINHFY